jgi:hypothetical protein
MSCTLHCSFSFRRGGAGPTSQGIASLTLHRLVLAGGADLRPLPSAVRFHLRPTGSDVGSQRCQIERGTGVPDDDQAAGSQQKLRSARASLAFAAPQAEQVEPYRHICN